MMMMMCHDDDDDDDDIPNIIVITPQNCHKHDDVFVAISTTSSAFSLNNGQASSPN